ncbi:Neurotrypsin,Scavenger receptor cysteine-rich type 1 protein M130,Mucin-like protein,Hemicentin-1,Thrombospondin-2,Semaphorin-5A [Mytilus coruscus]|uniref:Neurotrypsin,Scavenger receptor cysteine-rich type 1 protein M130,Mucin-like protein,Hemicentin-1,Thrombospondin-2,Semaphorin-5A n=1 Tax=Mytilus coruscus TaxID=42192 RepID=A0A6J8EQS2_MYTCO|nr:Neurotrypsin,Scavenger receptor cysteine-rich type 1 protein M130,Mucin-like protein,Hemicentin-1,Thrombospondin-2,Semaphorin-5A [Mytilus coruscus]
MDLFRPLYLHVVIHIKIFCVLSSFLNSFARTNIEGEIRLFYTSGDGTGQIWLDDLACRGTETLLSSCGDNGWATHNCDHDEDVGVWCLDALEGDLRLIGGTDFGRLEIFHSNSWGTICDDGFSWENAIVACRQMKLRSTNAQFYTAGNGEGMIWLDDVVCSKTKAGIDMCSNTGWGISDCSHLEDVGVRCYGSVEIFQGDLRLVGGNTSRDGRLEVYYNNQWGTVCDDQFDVVDARVACRQLRYSTNDVEIYTAGGASSNAKIWMDDLRCTAGNMRLEDCRRNSWTSNDCSHSEDIGIKCFGKCVERRRRCNSPTPSARGSACNGTTIQTQWCNVVSCPGRYYLYSYVGGNTSRDGRLEVYYNNQWGTVCDDQFDVVDARVACRQLRYSTNDVEIYTAGGASSNAKIWMDDLRCTAGNMRLEDCRRNSWTSNDCSHSEDIGIKCFGKCNLCSTSCGYGHQERRRRCNSPTPSARGSACNGTTIQTQWCNVVSCPVDGNWSEWSFWNICSATCNGGIQERTRKCNAPTPSNGGLYCSGTLIESRPCNNIFCESNFLYIPSPMFGGSDCIGLDFHIQICNQDICLGTERAIKDEPSKQFSAGLLGGVAVGCSVVTAVIIFLGLFVIRRLNPNQIDISLTVFNIDIDMWIVFVIITTVLSYFRLVDGQVDGHLRLVDGSHSREGRLEIYHGGRWGSVCNHGFGNPDGRVACGQLGFRCVSDIQIYKEGGYTATIWMHGVACTGFETSLGKCSFSGWGNHDCSSSDNVGIRCYGGCEGDLRLIGGSYYGRLEIYHSGSWGTVCNVGFDHQDALIVCRQLRLRTTTAQYYTAGNGNGTIWLNNVACAGNENKIVSCHNSGWTVDNCGHSKDIGVRCYGSYGNVEGDLRLVGRNSPEEGRLEIYHHSEWGTVCKDYFDTSDALVACRQLGYRTSNPNFYTAGGGSNRIWLDNMKCSGTERRLDACTNQGWGNHNCDHSKDVGIRCLGKYGVDGNWGFWSSSTPCIVGHGLRVRHCNKPIPAFGGSYCTGSAFQYPRCNGVTGNWGMWSAWTQCSSSCDSGYKTRHRLCNNPVPSNNGAYCNDKSFEVLNCSIFECRVDGSWGNWGSWSKCNVICGGGVQKRIRICDNPFPSAGGSDCLGIGEDTLVCSQRNCPVDGDWSEWEVWSKCSSSCGSGIKTRARHCNEPSPAYNGVNCRGNKMDSTSCKTNDCPVDGDWSEWSSWNNCSALCNGGIKERTRTCDAPAPSNGGIYCNGTIIDSRPCNNVHCQGAQLQEKEETSTSFSIAILGGVAAGCIVVTAAIFFLALLVCRRFRCDQAAKRKKNETNNDSNGELRETSRTNNYECIGPSNGISNGVYDTHNITRSGHANTQFNGGNEALYENLKI